MLDPRDGTCYAMLSAQEILSKVTTRLLSLYYCWLFSLSISLHLFHYLVLVLAALHNMGYGSAMYTIIYVPDK